MSRDGTVALISVIDDDESVRNSLSSLLRSAGYCIKAYGSAEAFLESGGHQFTACLVLDVRMPGLSGLELQQRLADQQCPTPIVFVTAHADGHLRDRALRQGAVAFLSKPFSGEDLLEAVRMALQAQPVIPR